MTWRAHLSHVRASERHSLLMSLGSWGTKQPTIHAHLTSYLPQVYAGQPQRIERYVQYDYMDLDPDVNAALDTITEFVVMPEHPLPFVVEAEPGIQLEPTEHEIIRNNLVEWSRLNRFDRRLFRIVRNTLKFGDQFLIRHPATMELFWVDPSRVQAIVVDRAQGLKIESYIISGLDFNFTTQVATAPPPAFMQTIGLGARSPGPMTFTMMRAPTQVTAGRWPGQGEATAPLAVAADHVLHISLSEGVDATWPFGISLLEAAFKTYKQKELLEDSIIIYRVQRAPERRVFYIDVGDAPLQAAEAMVERFKQQLHQRHVPNFTEDRSMILDAAYNPLSMIEDYFIPRSSDDKGSRVELLSGGQNLGEIQDLEYFDRKMRRALRVPNSYMTSGTEERAIFSDGRVGTAFIQEYRFVQYCKRLQSLIVPYFDSEFKVWLRNRDVRIDVHSFRLRFPEPQNFAKYRQIEIDQARMSIFNSLQNVPWLSKRFVASRFLGMTQDEIVENEKLRLEEMGITVEPSSAAGPGQVPLAPFTDSPSPDMFGTEPVPDFDLGEIGTDMEGGPGGLVGTAGTTPPGGGTGGAAPAATPEETPET